MMYDDDYLARRHMAEIQLADLPVPALARNSLIRSGRFATRAQIAKASDEELLEVRNFGRRCLEFVRAVIPYDPMPVAHPECPSCRCPLVPQDG